MTLGCPLLAAKRKTFFKFLIGRRDEEEEGGHHGVKHPLNGLLKATNTTMV